MAQPTYSSTLSAMVDSWANTPSTTSLFAAPPVRIQAPPVYAWNRLPQPSQTGQDTCGGSSSWIVVMQRLLLTGFKQKGQHTKLLGKLSMFSKRRRKRWGKA